jgi:hypothetical protein
MTVGRWWRADISKEKKTNYEKENISIHFSPAGCRRSEHERTNDWWNRGRIFRQLEHRRWRDDRIEPLGFRPRHQHQWTIGSRDFVEFILIFNAADDLQLQFADVQQPVWSRKFIQSIQPRHQQLRLEFESIRRQHEQLDAVDTDLGAGPVESNL